MSERCIKTGADVWLEEYGLLLHGDLFITPEGVYIFNANPEWRDHATRIDPDKGTGRADLLVHKIEFERRGVFVINSYSAGQSKSLDEFRAKWG